ncbi:helix-turn-helix transcriptional regulator [Pseudomonas aeruginosa]|jgi:transcriptional regulator with XRE-family HTH domain|uniref:helix-turn-helix domain-containing protein n=1 Tax=Pseudomonas aeruginosa TaxID=287 RepID=UPI001495927E|nr:helix-turn-helix transcriptional regulator [Pseudomonas aeruginosa]MBH9516750.1 helix-turn-helix transcriptional regulator [Pseudomonas aeruginosa]MCU9212129.1 helix-turn-helix transcriptional regulator [Pseudomonas aeruginosa]HCE6123137.1 helix-turn-helix transcriptional regulator [Pseudomonas aeruginosa]
MRTELKQALGEVLKSYRVNRNISQEGMGPSQTYISNIERGRWSASLDKIEQMSEVLGVHPASVIIAGYLTSENSKKTDEILDRIRRELKEIGL